MNGKFTIDFLYSQIKIMDKYEEALCNYSIPDKKTKEQCWDDFKAGQRAATQNYEEALYEIRDLQNRLANCLEELHNLKAKIAIFQWQVSNNDIRDEFNQTQEQKCTKN